MADINEFQVGNFIYFTGRHPLPEVPYTVIASIDTTIFNNGDKVYELYDLNSPDRTFVGYDEKIFPILLKTELLIKLGFTENDNIFNFQNFRLFSDVISTTDENGMPLYEIIKYRTLPSFINLPFKSKEEIAENTIAITTVHSLQNFSIENDIPIDFNQLKGFEVYY